MTGVMAAENSPSLSQLIPLKYIIIENPEYFIQKIIWMNHHNEVIHQNESDFRINYDRKHLIIFLPCSTAYSTVQLNKTKQNKTKDLAM